MDGWGALNVYRLVDNITQLWDRMDIFCVVFYAIVLISLPVVTKKKTKLNRGQVLAGAVEASRLNKEKVAVKAGYSRSGYYKHIANPDLDFHILTAYGQALGYDFTEQFPEMPRYMVYDPEENYNVPVTTEDAVRQRDAWKDKYYELLEKYNSMVEEQLDKLRKKN